MTLNTYPNWGYSIYSMCDGFRVL